MIELSDLLIALPGKTGTLHEILQTIETIQYGMDFLKTAENFKRLLIHSYWKKSIVNLNDNGNISQRVFNYLKDNYIFIDEDNTKNKNQLINMMFSINSLTKIEKNRKYDIHQFPIKELETDKELKFDNRLTKLITELNHLIYGSYFDSSKKNMVTGLDFALKEADNATGKLFGLESIGTPKYLKTLSKFLDTYKSIVDSKSRVNEWYQLNNINTEDLDDLYYHDHKNKSALSGGQIATIDDWIKYLKSYRLGKQLYWMSVKHERYHISAFLLINIFFSDDIKIRIEKAVNQFLLEYMLVESNEVYINDSINQATRAAISQVMARNMSHNIGSHDECLCNPEYIEQFCPYATCLKSYHPLKDDLDANDYRPFHQLAIYNNYVKNRMHYLADITFGTPMMAVNKKAYSDIYCELESKVIAGNISGRGEKFKYKIGLLYNGKELNKDNDIDLAIPNDVLGMQAFYNIIENIIRNTAKHQNASDVQIIVNIRDIEVKELHNNKKLIFESNGLYCVEIYDNISLKTEDTISNINNKINGKILNDNNELRPESLGMIEMDASAAYLRQLDIVSINSRDFDVENDPKIHNKSNQLNILKAYKASTALGGSNLGYRFFS
ncbi:MAG: hypothetical protein IPL20_03225 [Saprospiraceae bacterium]|nr:hypothetical protein [Saprospiraceae bacterium]